MYICIWCVSCDHEDTWRRNGGQSPPDLLGGDSICKTYVYILYIYIYVALCLQAWSARKISKEGVHSLLFLKLFDTRVTRIRTRTQTQKQQKKRRVTQRDARMCMSTHTQNLHAQPFSFCCFCVVTFFVCFVFVCGHLVLGLASGLEAFSREPPCDSVGALAVRQTPETRGTAWEFLSYYPILPSRYLRDPFTISHTRSTISTIEMCVVGDRTKYTCHRRASPKKPTLVAPVTLPCERKERGRSTKYSSRNFQLSRVKPTCLTTV